MTLRVTGIHGSNPFRSLEFSDLSSLTLASRIGIERKASFSDFESQGA